MLEIFRSRLVKVARELITDMILPKFADDQMVNFGRQLIPSCSKDQENNVDDAQSMLKDKHNDYELVQEQPKGKFRQ